MVPIEAEVHTGDIVRSVALADEMTRDGYAGLLEFILEIDERVCDLQFTIALRDELTEIIERERQ